MESPKKPSYKSYRYCIVPKCKNTTLSAPDKVFFFVPRGEGVRKKWCKIINRRMIAPSTTLYCCEDHFDVKKDTENYLKYNILKQEKQKITLRLKKGVVPHKFQHEKNTATQTPPVKKEPIDEVYEDGPNADDPLCKETVVKIEHEPPDENRDTLLHAGFKCDNCLSWIRGYRYSCVQCDFVDLCAACEACGAHDAHYVLRIPRPRPGDEAEIEEILNELREKLSKYAPAERPAEEIICTPSHCTPSVDPLQSTPVSLHVRSLPHSGSESDETSTSAPSDEDSPKRHKNIQTKRSKHTRQIVPPKRCKLDSYKNTTKSIVTYASSTIKKPNILKEAAKKSDTIDENSNTDEVSQEAINDRVLVNNEANIDSVSETEQDRLNIGDTSKKKVKASAIEEALSQKSVQQVEVRIKTEKEVSNDLEIADDDNLRESEGEDQIVELDDRLLVKATKRGRKQVINSNLQETDEERLDFVKNVQKRSFSGRGYEKIS